jgi:hypothetical protein
MVPNIFPDNEAIDLARSDRPRAGMGVTKYGAITGRTIRIIVDPQVDLYVGSLVVHNQQAAGMRWRVRWTRSFDRLKSAANLRKLELAPV